MKRGRRKWGTSPYCPTEQDIREACEEIQSQWSEHESLRRAGIPPKRCWMPPLVNLDGNAFVDEEPTT